MRVEPARRIGDALERAKELRAALEGARLEGGEREAVGRAMPLVAKAIERLGSAAAAFISGRLDAASLARSFEGQWALDEAADHLASSREPREMPSAAYDPEERCVVLFGGFHGSYALSDTWIYDCAARSWRQVWPEKAPSPRAGAEFRWDAGRRRLVLSGGQTILDRMQYQRGEMPAPPGEWAFDARRGEWRGEGGPAPGTRIYRTIVPGYDPRWYDAAPRVDREATERWLASLPPNVWTAVPPAPEREWGTAVFGWSGGYEADPSTLVATYHPAINRWSIPYVAEIMATAERKGMSFNGRPDCANHTYLHYAYDALSKRLVCVAMGGTAIYDPDRREFEFSMAHPFNRQIYETCTVSTPRGVVAWVRDWFGILDVRGRRWRKLPVEGSLPRPCCDGSAISYDAKRDVLWMATFLEYQKPSGEIWRYDMERGEVRPMGPANRESIGKAEGFASEIRESISIPAADLVLFNNFVGGRQVAYDPEGNRWVVLNIERTLERLGTVSDTLVLDAKRGLVWNLNAYKAIYVLRLDASRWVLSDAPPRREDKGGRDSARSPARPSFAPAASLRPQRPLQGRLRPRSSP